MDSQGVRTSGYSLRSLQSGSATACSPSGAFQEHFSANVGGINLLKTMQWASHSVSILSGRVVSYISCGHSTFCRLVSPALRARLQSTQRPMNVYQTRTFEPGVAEKINDLPLLFVGVDENGLRERSLVSGFWHEVQGWLPGSAQMTLPCLQKKPVLLGIRNITNVKLALVAAERGLRVQGGDTSPLTSTVLRGSKDKGWTVVAKGGLAENVTVTTNPLVRTYPGVIIEQDKHWNNCSDDALYLSSGVLTELCESHFGENRVFSAGESLKQFLQQKLEQSGGCSFLLESVNKYHHTAVFVQFDRDENRLLVFCYETLGCKNLESINTSQQLLPVLKEVAGTAPIYWGCPQDAMQCDLVNCGAIAFENLLIARQWPEVMTPHFALCQTLAPNIMQGIPIDRMPVAFLWSCQRTGLLSPEQLQKTLPWNERLGSFLDRTSVQPFSAKKAHVASDIRRYRLLFELSSSEPEALVVSLALPKNDSLIVSIVVPKPGSLMVRLPLPARLSAQGEPLQPVVDVAPEPAAKKKRYIPPNLLTREYVDAMDPHDPKFYTELCERAHEQSRPSGYVSRLKKQKVPLPQCYPLKVTGWSSHVLHYLAWKCNHPGFDPEKNNYIYIFAASVLKTDSHDYLQLMGEYFQYLLNKGKDSKALIDLNDHQTLRKMSKIVWNMQQGSIDVPQVVKRKGFAVWSRDAMAEILRRAGLLESEVKRQRVGCHQWGMCVKTVGFKPGSANYKRGLRQLLEQRASKRLNRLTQSLQGLQLPKIPGVDFGEGPLTGGKLLVVVLWFLDAQYLEKTDINGNILRQALKLFSRPEALTGHSLKVYQQLLAIMKEHYKTHVAIAKAASWPDFPDAPGLLQKSWGNLATSSTLPTIQWKAPKVP